MFQQPMFLILNLAIGGYDPSYTGVYSPAAVTAPFPARMYVDYIQLTDNGYTQLYFGNNTAETGNFGVFAGTTPVNDSLTYGTGLETNFDYSNLCRTIPLEQHDGEQQPAGAIRRYLLLVVQYCRRQLVRHGSLSFRISET